MNCFLFFRMLINERAFKGTSHYLNVYRHLLASRGNIPWLSSLPVPRFHPQFLYRLLYLFHLNDLCFYLTGSLVFSAVGVTTSNGTGGIFVVMTSARPNLVLNLLFRVRTTSFDFHEFTFVRIEREPNSDIVKYSIYETSKPFVRVKIVFFGVDSERDCGGEASLDLVQFCWDYGERYNSIKYAVVILPKFFIRLPYAYCLPKLICIRYYRAISDGWRDEGYCPPCTSEYQAVMKPFLGCRLPDTCRCNFCLRQPPKLRDAASHVLFKQLYNVEHMFLFTSNTTFNEYVYAVRSGRVPLAKLLPPQYPRLTIWCASNTSRTISHHVTCPGKGVWRNVMSTQFRTPVAAVVILASRSEPFWCMHCSRGLFFPTSCAEHP